MYNEFRIARVIWTIQNLDPMLMISTEQNPKEQRK